MERREWVKDQVRDIFKSKDTELVSIAYIKALLTMIGEEFESNSERQVLQDGITITTGNNRSPKRHPRLSKSQRLAAALREARENSDPIPHDEASLIQSERPGTSDK